MAALNNKKVCVLINSLAGGGAEKVVATLCPEYLKAGVELSLLCLETNIFYTIEGISPVYLSPQTGGEEGGAKKLTSLFAFASKLKKYVKDNQIDLVQSHIYRSNYVNILARLFGTKHKVQIVNHGMPSQYKNEGLSGKINRYLIRWLYPKADQVICPSQGMIEEFIELGVSRENTQLIQNPFDLEEITTKAKEKLDNPKFEFDPNKKYIISIGRLHAVKRMDDVIWAFHELQKEMDDVELIILGDGDQRESITSLIMELAIGKKIHIPGQVKNPYNYLARSNMLLSASEFEGFSNVIVEALTLGVPVISTDCESGPREIMAPDTKREIPIAQGVVERVQYGLMVAVGNIHAMSDAMKQLFADENLRHELSESGPKRTTRFDKTTIADDYIKRCAGLLGS
jgi:glycosyltransferase involved in cell wall biosynthesis